MAIIDMRQMIGPASENMHASSMLMVSEECRILASRTASVRAPSLMPCSSRSSREVHSCAAAVCMHGPLVSPFHHQNIMTAGGGRSVCWHAGSAGRSMAQEARLSTAQEARLSMAPVSACVAPCTPAGLRGVHIK